jgi:hypothetical protein
MHKNDIYNHILNKCRFGCFIQKIMYKYTLIKLTSPSNVIIMLVDSRAWEGIG